MDMLVSAAAVVVGLGLFWFGIKRVEVGTFWRTALSLADAAVLIGASIALGWLGAGLVVGATVVGLIVHSVRLAMQKEVHVVFAGSRLRTSKDSVISLHKQIYRSDRVFKQLGPITTAELIALLADRARSTEEIEAIARPVALLWFTNQKPELAGLVERFDRLLRVWDKSAKEAMDVADTLTVTAQRSAATFDETLDALLAVAS